MTYTPQPTAAVPTGMHQVIPNRNPSIIGVRHSFEHAFGGYVPADWTLDAECTRPGTDPGSFYPQRGGGRNAAAAAALATCAACLVREKCLEDALTFEVGDVGSEDVRPGVHGIRGGLGEKERRRMVQQIRVQRIAEIKEQVLADHAAGLTPPQLQLKYRVADSTLRGWLDEAEGVA